MNKNNKMDLVVIVGPTAVGKTATSVELADRLGAEIISGDSMQLYKFMDIGTAKIRPDEMTAQSGNIITHHLLDVITPDVEYSVGDFQKDASRLIEEIHQRGKLPMIVGGTGLYVQALIEGYTLGDRADKDQEFRDEMKFIFDTLGGEILHKRLEAIDPAAAAKIEANDAKRMIRALEIHHMTGETITEQSQKHEPPYNTVLIGLNRDRAVVYDRIEQRVDIMINDGFEAEVKNLLEMGYNRDNKPMRGLGYRQMCEYLNGEISYDGAIELIKKETRHFAKRQLTWWRRSEIINWFDLDKYSNVTDLVNDMEILVNSKLEN